MIYYVASAALPTKKAFGYAMAKMCASFAEHAPVTMVIPKSVAKDIAEDLFTFYGVPRNFKLVELPCVDLFQSRYLGNYIPFLIRKASFAVSVLFNMHISKDDICYSRDIWLLPFLRAKTKKIFLETHYLSRLDALSLRLAHFAKKIVVVTSFLKEELVRFGYRPFDILVAPSGYDAAEFDRITASKSELRSQLGLPVDKKLVLYSGNLFAWKGVYTLIDSWKEIYERFGDAAKLVILGGSEDTSPAFKKYVESKSYAGSVIIVGHKKHGEVAAYLKSADVLVIPNSAKERISEYNTSPIKLFEYMASGVPIVASDLPSMREILSDKNAFFAAADDPKSLTAAITYALGDTATAGSKALEAKKDVRLYDWKLRSENILGFLRR
jgi:glycosyltransferase involved in cell wall biosynthesis